MNNKGLLRIVLWELEVIKSNANYYKCNDLPYDDLISDLDKVIGKIKEYLKK